MKIAFVAPRTWPAVGGAESFLRHLSHALAERHEVTIVALSVGGEPGGRLWESIRAPRPFVPFRDGTVEVVPLELPRAARAALLPLALQVVPGARRYAYGRARLGLAALYEAVVAPLVAARIDGADVVQVWGAGLLAGAGVRAAELVGAPSFVMASLHPGAWGDDRASARTYRRATGAIAQLGSEAAAYRSLGVEPRRIAICGACSPGVEAGHGAALRARIAHDGPLIVYLGARRAYKGVDLLLEAAPLVRERVPDLRIAFVGAGAPLGAHDPCVLDVGAVDDDERAAWLEAADVVCLPSAAESFGLAVLEAWSVGTPVVTSDIPALHELVTAAGGGWTSTREPRALADVLAAALADPGALERAGARGRAAWLDAYTPAAVAARFESVFRTAVPTAGAATGERAPVL